MSEEKKEWIVPEELVKKSEEAEAMELLRDKYAETRFGFKKAMKCSIKNVQLNRDFWASIRDLYPEIKDKRLTYEHADKTVHISE